MKLIPLFKVHNMQEAIDFYTQILDFKQKYPEETADDPVVDLINEGAELQLTTHESETLYGSVINIPVTDIDERFQRYLDRGLDISGKANSPVHQGPIDQTWGAREFYVTDSSGNTLRFRQWITSE
ncbi:glyoxalase superfamily protein [Emticicia sp. BO119]|uniref:glyoxalase superfamily protein n=1 Tax=Emticicia sp. BO119 TaxID=2757768 RepID=UPI0015F00018|nr:glyoxalase superfamily protein [Emticicia sp. BO119]MBA4849450.1 VOC family protein [Emticicia sp. BO119]